MKKNFKYVVLTAVILIPFMYAFFYLKAYWDPYGKGNMDNIPVAIVNLDEGTQGKNFAEKLIESKKLNFKITDEQDATKGINEKKYYAIIKIPKDFTKNIESATTDDKTQATITYSPNQKTNYLASQIISRVLVVAEEETRGEISKTIISELAEKIYTVQEKITLLANGIDTLENGTKTLNNSLNILNEKYEEFDNGIENLYNGSLTLTEGIEKINNGTKTLENGSSNLNDGIKQINEALENQSTNNINDLQTGIQSINEGTNNLANGINNYIEGTNTLANGIIELNNKIDQMIEYYTNILNQTEEEQTIIQIQATIQTLQTIKQNINSEDTNMIKGANIIITKGEELKNGTATLKDGINQLNNQTKNISIISESLNTLKQNLKQIEEGTNNLNNGIKTLGEGTKTVLNGSTNLKNGLNILNNNSEMIKNGISEITIGTNKLVDGTETIKTSLEKSIIESKSEINKLKKLDEFAKNSVTIKEEPINEINSYGTAFGPFFMSIALWVGSLMLFIILYYDKNNRFKKLGENAENKLLRTSCYLALASLQGITLGILLMLGLDFKITNYLLYFISLILVSCLFESIMEFLIINLKDVGKFIALILLVLQLAAAGGTFPIETVTKGFRFLNPLLPMKYTCDLFKETIISIETGLLTKSMLVIIVLFITLFTINILKDIKKEK